MRDAQRSRVYRFERAVEATLAPDEMRTLSIAECEALAARARGRYGLGPLTVLDGRSRRRGTYEEGRSTIKLPRFARRATYVLHEVAHSLTPPRAAAHGPEYVRILIDLWVAFIPTLHAAKVRALAKQERVRVAARTRVPQAMTAREERRLADVQQAITETRDRLAALIAERNAIRSRNRQGIAA